MIDKYLTNLRASHKKSTIFFSLISLILISVATVAAIVSINRNQEVTSSKAASPATTPINRKVYALIYNPILRNGQRLSVYKGWGSPDTLYNYAINFFKQVTNNRVNYSIITTREINAWPTKIDGFTYTEDEYLRVANGQTQPHNPDTVDCYQFLNDPGLDICGRLNRQEGDPQKIDELWIMGGPWFGFHESSLATSVRGRLGFQYNGPTYNQTQCGKLLPMMGFSYQAIPDHMVHDFGHRMEDTMTYLYQGSEQNRMANNWDKFALDKGESPAFNAAGCGSIHYAPNSLTLQDTNAYALPNTVSSYCDDFNQYPNLSSPNQVAKPITCQAWGCNYGGYLNWWFRHLPHFAGTGPDGKLNDWWIYLTDPNTLPQPSNGAFTNLRADMYSDKAFFYFQYSGYSNKFTVDVSTQPNMSSDVAVGFVSALDNPLIADTPQNWDKYRCGRTLYWRIKSVTGTSSPIQATTVLCPIYIPYLGNGHIPPPNTYTPAPGGAYNSFYAIQNLSGSDASCSVQYYLPNGQLAYTRTNITITGNKNFQQYVPSEPLANNQKYSSVVSCNQPIAAVSNMSNGTSSGSFQGVTQPNTASTLYIPTAYRNYFGFYTTIIIQNTSNNIQTVTATFYDANGKQVTSKSASIPGYASYSFEQESMSELAANTAYSAQVVSTVPLASIVNIYGRGSYDKQLYSFNGFTKGSDKLYLPIVMRNYFGFNTGTTIQNIGAHDATVNVTYSNGDPVLTQTIKSKASWVVVDFQKLTRDGQFSATVKSASPTDQLIAVVNQNGAARRAASYMGFAAGSKKVLLPIVERRYFGYNSSVTCQNVGSIETTMTLTYAQSSTGNVTHSPSIQPLKSWSLFQPNDKNIADGVSTSAVVTSDNNQPIVCVVNQNITEGPDATALKDVLLSYEGIPVQ